MSELEIRESNLLVIAAVEGYAYKYNMSTIDVIRLFMAHDIFKKIRSQYKVLHMLDLDDVVDFAEDMLKRVTA